MKARDLTKLILLHQSIPSQRENCRELERTLMGQRAELAGEIEAVKLDVYFNNHETYEAMKRDLAQDEKEYDRLVNEFSDVCRNYGTKRVKTYIGPTAYQLHFVQTPEGRVLEIH